MLKVRDISLVSLHFIEYPNWRSKNQTVSYEELYTWADIQWILWAKARSAIQFRSFWSINQMQRTKRALDLRKLAAPFQECHSQSVAFIAPAKIRIDGVARSNRRRARRASRWKVGGIGNQGAGFKDGQIEGRRGWSRRVRKMRGRELNGFRWG